MRTEFEAGRLREARTNPTECLHWVGNNPAERLCEAGNNPAERLRVADNNQIRIGMIT